MKERPPARKRRAKAIDRKLGVPAGTPIHVGEKRTEQTTISVFEYDATGCDEYRFSSTRELNAHRPTRKHLWLNVHGLHDSALLTAIGQRFGLHPLTLEDVLNTSQRPKLEEYPAYLFLVLRLLDAADDRPDIVSDQFGLVVGRDFVLSFQEYARGAFDPVRERLRAPDSPLCERGADYLAYTLLDIVVDRYFLIVDRLAERAEGLEDEAMTSPTPALLARINRCKRDTLTVRRAVWPLRELVGTLQRSDRASFSAETRLYLRDVQDHSIHVLESLDGVRDQLGDLLEIYLSSVSNRLNLEVRVLTVLSILFLPATLIAGIWGMNFEQMPLIGDRTGFWWVIAMMGSCATLLAALFWRRRLLRQTE
ncbi:MAG: magnesium/cobalt transporter CorA [Rhodocyclaceae bacterium]|nr:magnesium/cobalt transporter CorA [Rhodocyclaceae bacterium]